MKNFKSLAALTAASMISLASVATPIFAAEDAGTTIGSNVTTTTGNVTGTNSTINYAITKKDTGIEFSNSAEAGTVFNGDAGVKFTVSSSTQADNAVSTDVIEYSDITISCQNPEAFPGAGVFMYQIQATSDGTEDGNKGITVNQEPIGILVFVAYDETGENLEVKGYAFSNPENPSEKIENPAFVHTYNPSQLTVTKKIAGNQADKNQSFVFTLTVNSKANGKDYKITSPAGAETIVNTDGSTTYTFRLKGDETATIDGLTADDTYTIEEDRAGYEATYTYQVGNNEVENGKGEKIKDKTASNSETETVVFTNTKDGTVPTGILMTAAPYVAVVGLGGVFAGMFFRRKRED